MYKITIKGKAHKFATLEAARAVANEIYQKTGIIVGIERC
jgi:hypothetical protein